MTAVLLIIFNRPATTKKVFDAIRAVQPATLYIAADAPHTHIDIDNCQAARAITESIDWPCEVHRLYQDKNLGCSLGPRAAFKWFFSTESEGIILEDDCLPNPSFFPFAAAMLEKYRNNKKIISINGSNLGYNLKNDHSYFYSRFMNMWGWATWADRAQEIDYELESWKVQKDEMALLHNSLSYSYFDYDINWYRFWKHKFDLTVQSKNVSWWDWQWIWHQLYHHQLSIVPAKNLVSNIGFNQDATHTKEIKNLASAIPVENLSAPYKSPENIFANKKYEQHHVKYIWCSYKEPPYWRRIFQGIKRIVLK